MRSLDSGVSSTEPGCGGISQKGLPNVSSLGLRQLVHLLDDFVNRTRRFHSFGMWIRIVLHKVVRTRAALVDSSAVILRFAV